MATEKSGQGSVQSRPAEDVTKGKAAKLISKADKKALARDSDDRYESAVAKLNRATDRELERALQRSQ